MELRYPTPQQLVEALNQRGEGARAQLWELLRDPVERILKELIASDNSPANTPSARAHLEAQEQAGLLTLHALHLAETWLRTRTPDLFGHTSWHAFRATVLLQVAKFASAPFGGEAGTVTGPSPLPESPGYLSRTFFRPSDQVGKYWFGGDWFAGLHAEDGALWVIVADITGHGYYAYLLASSLPSVWEACWQSLEATLPEPADLLEAMHRLLADCLPEGVFAECTLARLAPDGAVTVAPAGGTRFLLRRGGKGEPALYKLRGTWLGLFPPSHQDQGQWFLDQGDELLLGTDGLFDHLTDEDGGFHLGPPEPEAISLLDAIEGKLQEVLQRSPQKDDITMVMLCRQNGQTNGGTGAHRAVGGSDGEGNVSV
jgi:hypothetical protein